MDTMKLYKKKWNTQPKLGRSFTQAEVEAPIPGLRYRMLLSLDKTTLSNYPSVLTMNPLDHIALSLLLFATLLFGRNAMSKEPVIEIKIGESGASFFNRNSTMLAIDKQPAGLNFYQIRFSPSGRGQIILIYGDKKLLIKNVVNATATEDLDFNEEGLLEFHVNSALTDADLISHDDARLRLFSILENIVLQGWTPIIPLSMARLNAREMTKYLLASKYRTTLNPSYVPTFAEWMQMKSMTSWRFYTAHLYMTVSFTREHTLADPTKPGAYLISFEIRNEAEQFRRHVDGSDRKRWRDVLPTALRELGASRAKMESELRLKGFSIDAGYTDPPLPSGISK